MEWALIRPAPRVGGIGGWVRDARCLNNELGTRTFRPICDIFRFFLAERFQAITSAAAGGAGTGRFLRRFTARASLRRISMNQSDLDRFPGVPQTPAMGIALAVMAGGLYLFSASYHPSRHQVAFHNGSAFDT